MFGKKELEAENAQLTEDLKNLQAWVEQYKVLDAIEIASETARLASERDKLLAEIEIEKGRLDFLKADLVETDEALILQEVGIYRVRHRLDSAVAYKGVLDQLKDNLKTLVSTGQAVAINTNWQVDGSVQKGQKMQRDLAKLMLRAYNSEADTLVRTMKPYMLDSAIQRLDKAYQTIAKLGAVVQIHITQQYHEQRRYELEITADYLVKAEEEKERIREERAQQKEDEKARKQLEAERDRLEKERYHYESALSKLAADSDPEARAELETKLAEIDASIAGVEEREANIRAGYVYVISNVGAFGEHMVKIGLTRRLDPLDRVRELGDASVPFRFDVHAIIFSSDAVTLESTLHERLSDLKVNQVNPRREFFYATPEQVRDLLAELDGEFLLEYNEFPEALEWRESGGERRLIELGLSTTSSQKVGNHE